MPYQLLDRLVVLWVMPPFGFLITVLQLPILSYLNANYVIMFLITSAIAITWQSLHLPRRTVLYLFVTLSFLAAFMAIEWLHFLMGKRTLDDLTDLRMIIYSPFYGSIIIFTLYAVYLTILSNAQRNSHLDFVVKVMCWFHALFLGYWFLLYLKWVGEIPRADLLHSNSVAYGALFTLCVILFYRHAIGWSKSMSSALIVVNVAVIAVNQTRGAIIMLSAIALYFFVKTLGRSRYAVLVMLMLGAALGNLAALSLADGTLVTHVLGQDGDSLGIVLDKISYAYEKKMEHVEVSPDLIRDESSMSAFSRIGSNYYSLLSFLDNPVLGIGQAEAYSIKVLGAGVHSLHFLIANSTGVLGLMLFVAMLVTIALAQSTFNVSGRFATIFFIFFGYVLVFINSIPVYFALVLTLLASQRVVKYRLVPSADDRTR